MIFNWTDSRGDQFAVCDAADELEARTLIMRHAFAHYTEQGGTLAENHQRAWAFARTCPLKIIARYQFREFCQKQHGIGD
jgi:hypothetical protein